MGTLGFLALTTPERRPPKMKVLPGLVVGYTVAFGLWLGLRLVFFDRFWPLALVNTFAEYLFMPLPALAAAVCLRRRWRQLIPLAIPAAAFVALFGELFLPSWPGANGSALPPALTVTTFNVLWQNTNYAAVGSAVRANAPDVVGFQELHPQNFNGLAAELTAEYAYHAPAPAADSGGVGLFSRYPIEQAEPFPLPPRHLALHAILNVNAQPVHVFVVHLSANNFFGYPPEQFFSLAAERYASRASEAEQLRGALHAMAEPVIVLCDCNLTDTSQAYATLDSFLTDSHREAGWGLGHTLIHPPYRFRTQRLDYVWHNAAFRAAGVSVGPEGGSDHLPVTARLAFVQE